MSALVSVAAPVTVRLVSCRSDPTSPLNPAAPLMVSVRATPEESTVDPNVIVDPVSVVFAPSVTAPV